jgi:hypothetical protein
MDARELVGWVILTTVSALLLLGTNEFVSAVQSEIAESSIPMMGSYLGSATDTTLNQFSLFGQIGRVLTGFIFLAALGGVTARMLSSRRRSA